MLTYRKNVKDKWAETDFDKYTIPIEDAKVEMELCEKEVTINNVKMREIRKKGKNGHQTSILTTNRIINIVLVAIYMFSRWTQENFFKYLVENYDMDRMIQYAVEQIDKDFKVVNPAYSKINYQLKKTREKISRRRAKLYQLENRQNQDEKLTNTPAHLEKQIEIKDQLEQLLEQEEKLIKQRKEQPCKITIEDMADDKRYTSLRKETKRFQNIIKMICYRAETTMTYYLKNVAKKYDQEKRAIVKSIINTNADIIPDYKNKTLTISLYSQANPGLNKYRQHLCQILNESKTKYPNTNLTLICEIAS